MTVIAQVCLLSKIRYWWWRFRPTSPGSSLNSPTVPAITRGSTSHLLKSNPEPPTSSGSMSHRPHAAVKRPIASITRMIAKPRKGWPMFGDTCSSRTLFIPNQVAKPRGIRNTSQTKPALWIQVSLPAGIFPMRVPLVFSRTSGSPPNTLIVITRGTRICMVVTPKFPSPAFMPRA